MADNVPVTGGAGYNIRADEVSGALYQIVKVAYGADGVVQGLLEKGQQTMANSVPVTIATDQPQSTLITLADTSKAPGVVLRPHTSGGLTPYYNNGLTNVGVVVKNSPGQLYGYYISNENGSTDMYVKLYNLATTPTSASTPLAVYKIPKGGAANRSITNGLTFSTGIAIRATTGKLDNDDVSPGSNVVLVNLEYK